MELSINNISYKSNSIESKNTNNTLLMISGGAMLTPLIPFIDGEPLKKTYKDRNISKYATGLAAVGGAVVATRILSDKFIPETKTEKQKRRIKNILACTIGATGLCFVENWANISKKTFNKKYLASAPLIGALIGFVLPTKKYYFNE